MVIIYTVQFIQGYQSNIRQRKIFIPVKHRKTRLGRKLTFMDIHGSEASTVSDRF